MPTTKDYRFRVATAGASAVTGNVDFTETTNVSTVGPVGGQRVDPKQSRTAARPWSIEIADVSEAITEDLADANGRADLLRRLCDVSVSTDGGSTWTVLATGRVSRVEMIDVAAFRFTVQDERLIERTTTIFKKTNTTRIAPRGTTSDFMGFQADPVNRSVKLEVVEISTGNDTTKYRFLPEGGPLPNVGTTGLGLLEDDIIEDPAANAANFNNLKLKVDGTDRDVSVINESPGTSPIQNLQQPGAAGGAQTDIADVSTITVAGYQDSGGVGTVYEGSYLHMDSVDPSAELPLHIGGQDGVDPFTLVKNIYDGSYQGASNPATVLYESNAFSAYDETGNPGGLIDNPRFPKMHFRIQRPANMAKWLEDNIYGPLGVTPFVNSDGKVQPKITRLPASDQISDYTNLFKFDKTNTVEPHPSWVHDGKDLITVVEITFKHVSLPSSTGWRGESATSTFGSEVTFPTAESLDLFVEREVVETYEHDRVSTMGRNTYELTIIGLHAKEDRDAFGKRASQEFFDRFGDGPITTKVVAQSDSENVVAGDWVQIDLDSYPALQNQSRSGVRILQVLSKLDEPAGPTFECIEAGPGSQPVNAPSISAAQNTSNTHHAIDVTISGLSTGENYVVHVAENSSEPAEKSPQWQFRHWSGTGNETFTLGRLPSGKTFWARARATAPGRISSDWATATSATTQSLSAPSGLSTTGTAGDSATITWTNGEDDYVLSLTLDGNFDATLPAGSTRHTYTNLSVSTSYTAGVKHVDRFGGSSSEATASFTTTGTASVAPDMRGVRILVGETP